eukprot:SAG22_NODE_994_length_6119_cov_167.397674_8_plen_81_part_00
MIAAFRHTLIEAARDSGDDGGGGGGGGGGVDNNNNNNNNNKNNKQDLFQWCVRAKRKGVPQTERHGRTDQWGTNENGRTT